MAKNVFSIEMLPARHGDCLWIEYGTSNKRSLILIDGGPIEAFDGLDQRIDAHEGKPKFELMVMSHVDTDHVDGLVRLFAEKPLRIGVGQVWFNGWKHLNEKSRLLGGLQGEYFSALLTQRLPKSKWNAATKGKAVVVEDDGDLPEFTLEGGMKITLLSPTREKLETLRAEWASHAATKDIDPGDIEAALDALAKDKRYLPNHELILGSNKKFDALLEIVLKQDDSKANGSSIAFLAEFGGHSCLFLADAHPEVIEASLKRLLKKRKKKKLKVDATKLAHHGSKKNTRPELLDRKSVV